MSRIAIENGQTGLVVRTALNSMFEEIYSSIQLPVKLSGVSTNQTVTIPANSFLIGGAARLMSGGATIKIGTEPNGDDIFPEITLSSNLVPAVIQQYFSSETIIYITITGGGSINLRLDIINNYN